MTEQNKATVHKDEVSDIDKFFVNHKNASTTYWFATGKRPGLSLIISSTLHKNQQAIRDNVTNHNALFRRTFP